MNIILSGWEFLNESCISIKYSASKQLTEAVRWLICPNFGVWLVNAAGVLARLDQVKFKSVESNSAQLLKISSHQLLIPSYLRTSRKIDSICYSVCSNLSIICHKLFESNLHKVQECHQEKQIISFRTSFCP